MFMKNNYNLILFLGYTFLSLNNIKAQPFTPEKVVSTNLMSNPETVFSFDVDNDGDMDIISADQTDQELFWYENTGNGVFSNELLIDNGVGEIVDIYANDIDGDNDLDIFTTAFDSDQILWFENLGGGNFSSKNTIPNGLYAYGPASIRVADIDGDGLKDVIVASADLNDKIIWYKNDGNNNFTYTASQVVASGSVISETYSIEVFDVDNDGDIDIVSASYGDDQIAWHENQGNGSFSTLSIISSNADGARRVFVKDIDGDGDKDIVSASILDDKIAWYKNQGGGNFSGENIIATNVNGATDVFATDIDGDGDNDVVACGSYGWEVSWFENLGSGSFSTKNILNSNASYVFSVCAADLNNDGAVDVLSASPSDDKVAWYKNLRFCVTTYDSISSTICQGTSYSFEGLSISTSGVYHDTLINAEGCDSVRVLNLTVEPTTTPTISISSSTGNSFCDGSAFSFLANVGTGITNYSVQWRKDGSVISGQTGLTYNGSANSTFDNAQITCLLTTTDQCASTNSVESSSLTLDVNDYPIVNINFDGTVLSTNSGYDTYQWYLNTTAINGATVNQYTPTQNGEYEVRVTNQSCEETDSYNLMSLDLQNKEQKKQSISVYPTSFSGDKVLTIESNENLKGRLLITGLDGKKVESFNIFTNKSNIYLSNLSAGIFILSIESNNEIVFQEKLIVID